MTHIIMTPFTGLGLNNGYKGDDWLRERIKIFKDYTLRSLLKQTNKDFLHWVCWRKEEINNIQVQELEMFLNDVNELGYNFVFTFNGIPMWDDKYENDNLDERLKKILPIVKDIIIEKENVYMTLIASDDMLRKDFVETIKKEKYIKNGALYNKKGYVFDTKSKKLADWNRVSSGANYTLMFSYEEFINPQNHFEFQKDLKTHELIPELFNAKLLPDNMFCCTINGNNISTIWDHKFKGKEYINEKDKILKDFGIIT